MNRNLPEVQPSKLVSPLLRFTQYTEFKRLLDQVASSLAREGQKSVAILSELPQEGKTFFVSALALGYATLLGKTVLIVNTQGPGVDPWIRNQSDHKALVHGVPTLPKSEGGTSNRLWKPIDIISPHLDEELSQSSDFQIGQYINAARERYDIILADTCALSSANRNNVDPIVIARHVDTSVLLTSRLSLNRKTITDTQSRLKQWNIKLTGVIHNSGAQ